MFKLVNIYLDTTLKIELRRHLFFSQLHSYHLLKAGEIVAAFFITNGVDGMTYLLKKSRIEGNPSITFILKKGPAAPIG